MNDTLSTHHKLEPFLLQSKTEKGIGNAKLISEALEAPGVYVFKELYSAPNVVQASQLPEVLPFYNLLRIFMYGTWKDYQEQKDQLPTLTESQKKKLLHLTLLTLSENTQTLYYDVLSRELDIPTVRELEDLIMEAIYNGIVKGKLDQNRRQLQVIKTIGRDLGPERIKETIEALSMWSVQTTRILGMLDAKIDHLKETVNNNEQMKIEYSKELKKVLSAIAEDHRPMPNTILHTEDSRQLPNRQSRGPKRLMVEKS